MPTSSQEECTVRHRTQAANYALSPSHSVVTALARGVAGGAVFHAWDGAGAILLHEPEVRNGT